jgi:hypothetical protein
MFAAQDNESPKPILVVNNNSNNEQSTSQANMDEYEIKQPIGTNNKSIFVVC